MASDCVTMRRYVILTFDHFQNEQCLVVMCSRAQGQLVEGRSSVHDFPLNISMMVNRMTFYSLFNLAPVDHSFEHSELYSFVYEADLYC